MLCEPIRADSAQVVDCSMADLVHETDISLLFANRHQRANGSCFTVQEHGHVTVAVPVLGDKTAPIVLTGEAIDGGALTRYRYDGERFYVHLPSGCQPISRS